ncbi:MAG: SWIM zinc finger family protein, partial [Candidatus Heimdallarchaeota archaeon]
RLNHFQTKIRKAKDGITPSSDTSEQSWWSEKFIEAMDYFESDSRITQGKTYAKKGQVHDLQVGTGVINAKVQCTKARPFSVKIEFNTFSNEEWFLILNEMVGKASFAAGLSLGKIPRDIQKIFRKLNLSFFPKIKGDIKAACNCPDWANPCKHVAAVYFIFADMLNSNPALLFMIRGKTIDEITEILNEMRISRGFSNNLLFYDKPLQKEKIELSIRQNKQLAHDDLNSFFRIKPSSFVDVRAPKTESKENNILAKNKLSDLDMSGLNLSDLLLNSYETASKIVKEKYNKND